MGGKGSLTAAFVLRVLTLSLLAASIAVLLTDNFTPIVGPKLTFKDVITYRYVVATSVIGCAYLLFQMPFALYMACKGKRLIRNDCFSHFDFFADKVISLVLASGAAAGFAATKELKKSLKDFITFAGEVGVVIGEFEIEKDNKFYDKAMAATAILFFAAICMALVSIFSSIHRTWQTNGFFGR